MQQQCITTQYFITSCPTSRRLDLRRLSQNATHGGGGRGGKELLRVSITIVLSPHQCRLKLQKLAESQNDEANGTDPQLIVAISSLPEVPKTP